MLKSSIIGIAGFIIGAGTVETINLTKSEAQIKPAATVSMPSINELCVKTHAESLPDQTVKEPY
jgi:hypothetical protein